jgi:tight adherence protein B
MNAGLCGFASGAVAVPAIASAVDALDRAGWLAWLVPTLRSSIDEGGGPGLKRSDLLPTAVLALGASITASATLGVVIAVVVPLCLLAGREAKRRRIARDLERTLPAAMRAIADSIAAGATLERAAATAGGSAAGLAFRRFAAARSGGADLDSALGILVGRDREGIWAEVTAAISLRRRCGGDLGSALRAVAGELDEISKAKREARAATAQARFTANLVCGLPLMVGLGCELLRPGAIASVGSNPLTLSLTAGAIALQVLCLIVIRRMAEAVTE